MPDRDDDRSRYVSPSFFVTPAPFTCLLVGGGMLLCHLACYSPHLVPENYLFVLKPFYNYVVHTKPILIQIIYHGALMVHIAEALYSVRSTLQCGVTDGVARFKWFMQTLLFGVFSLTLIKGNLKPKTT